MKTASITLPEEMWQQIEQSRKRERRSKTKQIETLLAEALKNRSETATKYYKEEIL